MHKAVFLDRDGILIRERGDYTWLAEHIEILEGSVEALLSAQEAGYLLIVITNQSGISKGLYSHARLYEIHEQIRDYYAGYGIRIQAFYYCPHHPEQSLCICRKPDSQLLEKAIGRFAIDASQSWFIGDKPRDYDAGLRAGVHSILVEENMDLRIAMREILDKA